MFESQARQIYFETKKKNKETNPLTFWQSLDEVGHHYLSVKCRVRFRSLLHQRTKQVGFGVNVWMFFFFLNLPPASYPGLYGDKVSDFVWTQATKNKQKVAGLKVIFLGLQLQPSRPASSFRHFNSALGLVVTGVPAVILSSLDKSLPPSFFFSTSLSLQSFTNEKFQLSFNFCRCFLSLHKSFFLVYFRLLLNGGKKI